VSHFPVGVKEVLALPREVLEDRFNLTGDEGLDIEILGGTQGIPGGGFLYTNLDTIAVGVVLSLAGLRDSGKRPEEIIAALNGSSPGGGAGAGADRPHAFGARRLGRSAPTRRQAARAPAG
jgi:hypothetical protein